MVLNAQHVVNYLMLIQPIATDVWHFCDVRIRYPAKTVEPIKMPFVMWGRVGHSNHELDGGPDPQGEGPSDSKV